MGKSRFQAIRWQADCLYLLDQRQLPHVQTEVALTQAAQVATAIKDMVVRGAPAIGITAAYGVVLAAKTAYTQAPERWQEVIQADLQQLAQSRPTAVNLSWALQRMMACFPEIVGDPTPRLLIEAQRIHQEDSLANQRMGEYGAALLPENCRVLTHCNAGALAVSDHGTALGVIRSAFAQGKIAHVYVDETRPWFQGSRLTAWELMQETIPFTVLVDSAAALLMQQGRVDWVIVGADRIAANGDVANKIGTYSLAVLARQHGVKFMVVAPTSTLDKNTPSGSAILIEERSASEVLTVGGRPIALADTPVWNPVFDVTPAHLVDVLVTEQGVMN